MQRQRLCGSQSSPRFTVVLHRNRFGCRLMVDCVCANVWASWRTYKPRRSGGIFIFLPRGWSTLRQFNYPRRCQTTCRHQCCKPDQAPHRRPRRSFDSGNTYVSLLPRGIHGPCEIWRSAGGSNPSILRRVERQLVMAMDRKARALPVTWALNQDQFLQFELLNRLIWAKILACGDSASTVPCPW
jgi:hypothetical protein